MVGWRFGMLPFPVADTSFSQAKEGHLGTVPQSQWGPETKASGQGGEVP